MTTQTMQFEDHEGNTIIADFCFWLNGRLMRISQYDGDALTRYLFDDKESEG